VLALFLKDLRLLGRDRRALIVVLVGPLLAIAIIATVVDRERTLAMRLPVVNEDRGPVARTFIQLLGEYAVVTEVSRSEAEALVRDRNQAAAAILFPAHLSAACEQGRPAEFVLLTDPARGSYVEQTRGILLLVEKRAAGLVDPVVMDRLSLREVSLTRTGPAPTRFEQAIPGYLLTFALLVVVLGTAMSMYDEHAWGMVPRLLIAPGRFTSMLVQKLLVRLLVGSGQLLLLLLFCRLVLGVSLGPSPLAALLLVPAVVFPIVGLGMLTAGLAGSREQTVAIGLACVLIFAYLGGLRSPLWAASPWVQRLSPLAFTSWAMQGMSDLMLRGRGLEALPVTTGLLLVNGICFSVLGIALFHSRYAAR
jgi:ABC-2 type transport system permease protein